MLLSAIRNSLEDSDYNKQAIDKKYLTNEFGRERFRVKLKQTESDENIFDKILLNQILNEEEKNSKLYRNYEYFTNRIKELSNENISVIEFYNAVGNLDIVDLDLKIDNDLEAVQKILEKINSTGKPLSSADLIRNYLLIADTSEKQLELYKNYWVKLEDLYDNKDNISDFAKHYLITKRGDWVENSKMYAMFKSYFSNMEAKKEDILAEMLRLSKYYNWFKNASCENSNLNVMIKQLNILKSDDMYSLLLVLFDKLYGIDNNELNKIMDLLVDYMIRYRIVGLSRGSADLRNTLFTILTKITSEEIEIKYDNIRYELSNSPSPNGRFPNDEEFKLALQSKVNISYAKSLLYKMEYKETKNIFVDISEITIEHVLPQSITPEWISYLGGEEDALKIHNRYLNCIGNLAMLSGSYNSSNSNRMWDYKKETLSNAQFILTQNISKYDNWFEASIKDRNEYLSELALKYISGPLPREKEYKTIESGDEFKPGIYEITDTNLSVTGKYINSIIIDKDVYQVSGWFELIYIICDILHEKNSVLLNEVVKANKIHKSTSTQSYPLGKDPILSIDKKYLVSPVHFEKGDFYIEQCLSAERSRNYACELLKQFGLLEITKIDLS